MSTTNLFETGLAQKQADYAFSRHISKGRLRRTVYEAIRLARKTDVLYPLDVDLADEITERLHYVTNHERPALQAEIDQAITGTIIRFYAVPSLLYPVDARMASEIAWHVYRAAYGFSWQQWLGYKASLFVQRI